MNRQYYFVGTSLPPLHLGEKPEISWRDLQRLLADNLAEADYVQTQVLRRYYDLLNIRSYLKKEPIDKYGNLDLNELEETIVDEAALLPSYMMEYLERYESKEARIDHFPQLMTAFFREEVVSTQGFLKSYLSFEKNLRLILTAYRAKKLERDMAKELQFENFDEDIVVQLISQKDSKTFEPPAGFEELKTILDEKHTTPLALQKALNEYRLKTLEKVRGLNVFSFDSILAYLASFILVEKWSALDKEQGLQIVDTIIKGKL
ncbi:MULTISPECIES: DUF2764 family protein [unclassified Neochlamydia]|uniref:DUF2764 family protein n=1 Tax=unclassified Neochlamydia TaxID=2643326 RepID=UPI001BC9915A|nr:MULTISPECIES: DUF2764 family protein [unclassified Neochlamydia]MBS4166633.1 Uncharacterized protein [Neochlamydia sp. AcF65]MBS4171336.1 Uncharacterized protein [Neochlamydia sp. AcF95]